MLDSYENYIRELANNKLQIAYYDFLEKFIEDDIFIYVPPYFKKILRCDRFNGKKIRKGYENKIIIVIERNRKVVNFKEYEL